MIPTKATAQHIRVIRHALGLDLTTLDGTNKVLCNNYVATIHEFQLLDEMVNMGLMEHVRSAYGFTMYEVTKQGGDAAGFRIPSFEELFGVPRLRDRDWVKKMIEDMRGSDPSGNSGHFERGRQRCARGRWHSEVLFIGSPRS